MTKPQWTTSKMRWDETGKNKGKNLKRLSYCDPRSHSRGWYEKQITNGLGRDGLKITGQASVIGINMQNCQPTFDVDSIWSFLSIKNQFAS